MTRIGPLVRPLLAAAALLPAACALPPAETAASAPASAETQNVVQAVFLCGSERVATRFAGDALTLWLGSTTYELERAISASGARYTGTTAQGEIEFWNRGDEAMLTIGGQQFPTCKEVAERPVSGSGGDPAWTAAEDATLALPPSLL